MRTDEELTNFAKAIMEGEKPSLAANEFHAKFVWHDADETPTLFMFPAIEGPGGRDKIAWAVRVLTAAQNDVDSIAFITDTYSAHPHPETGKVTRLNGAPWEPGGMQKAVEEGQPDAVLVYEMVTLNIGYADGNLHAIGVPYDRHDGTVTLKWDEAKIVHHLGREESMSGHFPKMLQDAFMMTKLFDRMDDKGLTWESFSIEKREAEIRALVAVMGMVMKETQWPCAVAVRSEEEAQILQDAIARRA